MTFLIRLTFADTTERRLLVHTAREQGGAVVTKHCLMVDCLAPAAKGDDFCPSCGHWARVTLADVYYRNHKPPERPRQGSLL